MRATFCLVITLCTLWTGRLSVALTIQNPSPSKLCLTTAFAEPTGLSSGLAEEVVLSFCLDESASKSFFFLGFRHSHAQCPGLPQLWQFPGQHFQRLPSDPVAARALSACPSFLFPPCPCWLHAWWFFSCSDSSQMLFMSVSVPTTWLLIWVLDRSRVANFASSSGRLLSIVH
jgi:hypothetical protein